MFKSTQKSLVNDIMSYQYFNYNPVKKNTGDCVIRAISVLMDQSWMWTYLMVCLQGFLMCEMPSTNTVWGAYLYNNGFRRHALPDTCPDCYTVRQFCKDFPTGKYLLALNGHVVAVVDGIYYDTWDSGDEIPLFYWRKEQ